MRFQLLLTQLLAAANIDPIAAAPASSFELPPTGLHDDDRMFPDEWWTALIKRVNEDPTSTWHAKRNPRFENITVRDYRALMLPTHPLFIGAPNSRTQFPGSTCQPNQTVQGGTTIKDDSPYSITNRTSATITAQECANMCEDDMRCVAWSWVPPSAAPYTGCYFSNSSWDGSRTHGTFPQDVAGCSSRGIKKYGTQKGACCPAVPSSGPKPCGGNFGSDCGEPATFDSRQTWPHSVYPVYDQGVCGSCWSFATSYSLAARFAIASGGAEVPPGGLSVEYSISCDKSSGDNACGGGDANTANKYLESHGLPSWSCIPYTNDSIVNGHSLRQCPAKCVDGKDMKFFRANSSYSFNNVYNCAGRAPCDNGLMRQDIVKYGPVAMYVTACQDFIAYSGGIFKHVAGQCLGGHFLNIIGWGEEDGQWYWLGKNEWGTSWGEAGYFRMRRGYTEMSSESYIAAAHPLLSSTDFIV